MDEIVKRVKEKTVEEIAKIKARTEEDKPKKIKTVDGKSIRRKE